jgi:Bifunctional DNA primase/polymerase, N-terminal
MARPCRAFPDALAVSADSFESALTALGLDPNFVRDGWRANHAFPVAVRLAMLGFRVLPTRIKTKIPFLKGWPERAATDPAKLAKWQAQFHPNWSVLTGRENGVVVLDIDGEQGRADLAQLESKLGPLPDTWRCNSGRVGGCGFHIWLRPPPGTDDLRNQQPIPGTKIDVRGHHGHVIVAGSAHRSGNSYSWSPGCSPDEMDLAECPAEWWDFLPKRESAPARTLSRPRTPSTRRGLTETPKHNPMSRLIGDGIGEGGFNRPIHSRCCQFFARFGPDADPSRFRDVLREAILNANAANHTPDQIARYASDDYLGAELTSARKWIITRKREHASHYGRSLLE